MKAGDELLSTVFSKDHRYVIPIFQRPYVWNEPDNWAPLWNDLRKAAEDAEATAETDGDAPEYFLGAFVTQHRQPVPRRKPTSMVIDGQQRMTTLQVFLAAARRIAVEFSATQAADNFGALVRNRVSQDSEFPEDAFKVAPLEHDRPIFEWAVRAPSDDSACPNDRHRLAQAASYFDSALRDWVRESPKPEERLDLLHFAVESRIKVVSIFLEAKDDPQVIFEALNHRGVRLDAADLVKNLLFQTLDRQGNQALERDLLTNHWSVLDDSHWRTEITTGRIKRVRVDILLAYWLSAQRGEESSVEHLFEDFKRWMKTTQADAATVIRSIRTYANTMDMLLSLPMESPVAQALDRLDSTGTTTPWPLILFLHAEVTVPQDQAVVGTMALDSFLTRRAVCRLGTKDYNRLFGSLLGTIKSGERTGAGTLLVSALAAQTAENRYWPADREFVDGLLNPRLYTDLVRARLRTVLVGLENQLITSKSEPATPHRAASKALTIEHIMPVSWRDHWSLPSDSTDEQLERRAAAVHSLGNLTLATQGLNSSLSNDPWTKKRHTLQTHSLARLTTGSVLTYPEGLSGWTQDEWVSTWDEQHIDLRAKAMVAVALKTWPHPNPDSDPRPKETSFDLANSESIRERRDHAVHGDLLPLLSADLVRPGDLLEHRRVRSGEVFRATVTSTGDLDTVAGRYQAPSTALSELMGSSRNGWTDWTHTRTGRTLDELRTSLPD
ncbi:MULTISPECIES: GmrSD restriction endonuclease domain-containing protein [unclassified Knoellia]|uniref:GmrSD restriction endonuclease domain-containing protein n=1 Tax=Knoellia altitudinis TaxID=3404795 RepID=UPI0036075157